MIRSIIWSIGILSLLLILQTTVLNSVNLWGIKPSFYFLVFVIICFQLGSMPSQIIGFILGIIVDTITLSPLGFHAFIYALAGYVFGLGKGKVYFDPILVPAILGIVASLYEVILSFFLSSVFNLGNTFESFVNITLLIQILLNLIICPIILFCFNYLKERFSNPHRGFNG